MTSDLPLEQLQVRGRTDDLQTARGQGGGHQQGQGGGAAQQRGQKGWQSGGQRGWGPRGHGWGQERHGRVGGGAIVEDGAGGVHRGGIAVHGGLWGGKKRIGRVGGGLSEAAAHSLNSVVHLRNMKF